MGLDLPRPPKGSFSWSAARSGHKDNEALALPALATMVCRITNGSALLPDVDGGEDNASTAARSIIRRATGGAARVGRDLRELVCKDLSARARCTTCAKQSFDPYRLVRGLALGQSMRGVDQLFGESFHSRFAMERLKRDRKDMPSSPSIPRPSERS